MVKKNERLDTKRLTVYYAAAFVFIIVLVIRLFQIQILQREEFKMIAIDQYLCEVKLPPKRGLILDRNMTKLAINIPTVAVIANPQQVDNPQKAANELSRILGKPSSFFMHKLRGKTEFVFLSRRESKSTGDKINSSGIEGIEVRTEMSRTYPKGRTASQLIGFTNIDNEGLSGIELSCESLLKGKPGKAILQKTGKQKVFRRSEYPIIPSEDGLDVVLTINYIYQAIAEAELRNALVESNAERGTVVIMNPKTGEILTLASEPGFDPNGPGRFHPSSWRLNAITDQYEPGSTFKLVLFSALLNEELRKPGDLVFCENGQFNIMGETIHDTSPYGWLTLRDVLVKSSNIGMAKTSMEVKKSILYQYARDFGFGQKAGIELKGEIDGILKPTIDWSGYTPLAMAIGHEVAVTPLQICNMFSTIANGGLLMKPYIIQAVVESGSGSIVQKSSSKVIRRVLENATTETMKEIMQEVIERGTATRARIQNINICGKTGTARKIKQGHLGYLANEHIASFGGFFPREDPQICIFVMIDNPKGRFYGGEIAAPCFKRIAERIIAHEGFESPSFKDTDDDPETSATPVFVSAPQFIGFNKRVAREVAEKSDLRVETIGMGNVVIAQQPEPGAKLKNGEKIILKTGSNLKTSQGNQVVPAVVGLPLRNALNVMTTQNFPVVVIGTGKVVKQQPAAGIAIKSDEQVLLHCESSIDLRKLLIL